MFRVIINLSLVSLILLLSSCSQFDNGTGERIEGLYLSEQTATSDKGEPCYYLVRFYNDGAVIQSGICSASVKDDWPHISQWFHRNSLRDLARGTYTLTGNNISFKVSAHFRELDHNVTLRFEGEYSENSLLLNLYSETTGEKWLGMKWSRLELEE